MFVVRLQRSRAALFSASLLFSFLLAEGLLRVFFPSPHFAHVYSPPQEHFFQYDSALGWRGRPGAEGPFSGADFDVRVRHNQAGHRSSAQPHVEAKRNVLILGDSLAWGWGVENEEVFAERMMLLDRRLNVYNLAAAGYGTDQELLAFRDHLERYPAARIDDVILVFFINDFLDVMAEERYGYPKPRFRLQGGELSLHNVPVPRGTSASYDRPRRNAVWKQHPLRRLHLANLSDFALDMVRWRIAAKRQGGVGQGAWLEDQGQEKRWQGESLAITSGLIHQMAALSGARGARFQVILVRPGRERLWRRLQGELAEGGITTSVYEGRSYWRRTDLWLDRHLNSYGHRILARFAIDQLAPASMPPTQQRMAER
jgi:hypothetical protein